MTTSLIPSNSKISANFSACYQALNPAQRQAVDEIDGPVMVIAGPGTGKTHVLTTRIANILRLTDTNPSSILALTFTDSAAKNMRQRLVDLIGQTGYYVQINTFHSFCSQVMVDHREYFNLSRQSQPLTELERFSILTELINTLPIKVLRNVNVPDLYLLDISNAISDLKREGVSPDKLAKIVAEEEANFAGQSDQLSASKLAAAAKEITKHQDLVLLYRAYQQRLPKIERFDFEDMISQVVTAFAEHEDLRRDYQEKLQYLLVDEYQDTNSSQNQVVQWLAQYWGPAANVFVVGDPHQAIFRFQGASIENMLGFLDQYPKAKVITLTTGYRCPQQLYDAASELIKHNQLTLPESVNEQLDLTNQLTQPLRSSKGSGELISFYQPPVSTWQAAFVADEISQLIKTGVDPAQIVILVLRNSEMPELITALDRWQIKFEIDGGQNILESPLIIQLLSLMELIVSLRSAAEYDLFFKVAQLPWFKLDALCLIKLSRAAAVSKKSLFDLLDLTEAQKIELPMELQVDDQAWQQVKKFRAQLAQWSQLDLITTLPAWFEQVINESGLISWLKDQPANFNWLIELNSLFNQIKTLSTHQANFKLADLVKSLQLMRQQRLKIVAEDLNLTTQAVHLSTVHKAKGQEWDYVYVVNFVDGRWGNQRRNQKLKLPAGILQHTDLSRKEHHEDDRRLAYVALTRARKKLTMISPQSLQQENSVKATIPSLFKAELINCQEIIQPQIEQQGREVLLKMLGDSSSISNSTLVTQLADQESLATQNAPLAHLKTEKEQLFAYLVKDFKLSVSALNRYLNNVDDFINTDLLRLPQARSSAAAFGTAVHQALEFYYRQFLEKKHLPSIAAALTVFEQALGQEILTSVQYQERLVAGRQVLTNYLTMAEATPPPVVIVEQAIGYGWHRAVLADTQLVGRIDRIDWDNRDQKTVKLIDYKTGKSKTMGEITATTKTALTRLSPRELSLPAAIRSSYQRQLLFYKLLTQLDRSFGYQATSGGFEFVEAADLKSVKKKADAQSRSLVLDQSEVSELKKMIEEVIKEIKNLAFLTIN